MPFIGNAGQFSNIYEKNYETTTLYVVEGDAVYQAYNPDDSHYKLITNLQEITDVGNVTSNTVQFSNAITGFVTTSNIGIANSMPVHTLDIGSNVFIDDVGQKKISTTGTIHADEYTGSTITVTDSVTTRDVIADRVFPKTNGFIQFTSNIGILNTAPTHTLDIGANVQINEYGSNTFWTSGNVYSTHYKGSNVTVTGSTDSDGVIVNRLDAKDTDFIHATSNVGILNTAPTHTLDIGANVQIDEYGSNTFWTSGNVHANIYTGSEIQLSGVIRATDFILTGGSPANPTPDLQTISEVLAPGGSTPFSSDRTMTLSNTTTALDATVIHAFTVNSNLVGNNVTAITVNSNLVGNNVTAVTVNSNLVGNNVTAVTVNSNLIGNNVTAVTVSSNLVGNNVSAVTVNSNLIGNNVTVVTVNSNLIGNNVTAVTVNSNLVGNNVTAVTVNSNLIGNNVTAVTVSSNLVGNNVTAVTVNSNLIGNNVTAVTVNSNIIGNNVTAVTVNSNIIGNNVSASFFSGNGDLIFRKYTLGVNGISAYRVSGPGFTSPANDPTLTFIRGQIYVFDNTTYYTSHPLKIRTSYNGTDYTTGVVDDGAGTTTFTVPMNAPIKLYYQCETHADMGNTIYIPLENLDTSETLNLSNDLVVDTDKLIVDVSEGKVGINKSVPTKALDVTGEIECSSDLTVGGSVIATGTVSGSSSLTPGDYLTGTAYTGASNQTFAVDATSANTVSKVVARDASGNFSAGTITATFNGNGSSLTDLNASNLNSGTVSSDRLNLIASDIPSLDADKITTGTITRPVDTTTVTIDDYLIHDGDTDTKIGFPASDTFTVTTANGERLRVDSSGNVGIGKTTPTEKLDVAGSGVFNSYMQVAKAINQVSSGTDVVILLTPSADGNKMSGTICGIESLSGSKFRSGTLKLEVIVNTNSQSGGHTQETFSFIKHAIINASSTYTPVTCDYNGKNWFAIRIQGDGAEDPWYSWFSGLLQHNGGDDTLSIVSNDGVNVTNVTDFTFKESVQHAEFSNQDLIVSGGDVGIGTINPAYKLDVHGTSNVGALTTTSVSGDGSGLTALNGDEVTTGTLSVDRIPDLSANKITSDVLGIARIPDLSANKITSDVLGIARIPDLSASKITSGTLSVPISTTIGSFSSNVGIGTTSPGYKLHVYGDANGIDLGPIAAMGFSDSGVSFCGIKVGQKVSVPYSRTALSVEDSGVSILHADGFNQRVGIGTATPSYPLTVTGSAGNMPAMTYFASGSTNLASGGGDAITIYAAGNIYASGLIAASDKRIKKNIVDADDAECLETLRLLKPKKYEYRDAVARGEEPVWGFIAQEVRETLQYATQLGPDVIPNIYELANVSSSNVITFVNFNTSNLESNATTLIRTKGIDGQDHDIHLAEVIDEHTIRVEEDLSAWIGSVDETGNVVSGNQLFVYGQEVDDFVFVKKEAIWTVATSAIQEIDRQQQADKLRIAELERQLASVLARLDA